MRNKTQNIIKKLSQLAGLILLLYSCVDDYWPSIDQNHDDLLVVNGMITNGPGPFKVTLSKSSIVTQVGFYQPVIGYLLYIQDELGNSCPLTEEGEGEYMTPDNFEGVIGRSYKLIIHGENENVYESPYQKILQPSQINDVYYELEDKVAPDRQFETTGYQFFINGNAPVQDSTYLLWKLTETYMFKTEYPIRWLYEGSFPYTQCLNPDTLRTCFITESVEEIFSMNTKEINSSSFEAKRLHFVDNYSNHLVHRYSLLVKQLTVNKQAYNYWHEIQEMINSNDFSYKIPYQVNGNINNVNNYDESVLGYFIVAGKSEKRIFVDPLPYPIVMRHERCVLSTGAVERMKMISDYYRYYPKFWPVYITELIIEGNRVKALPPDASCLDCREKGGVLEVPDFWVE